MGPPRRPPCPVPLRQCGRGTPARTVRGLPLTGTVTVPVIPTSPHASGSCARGRRPGACGSRPCRLAQCCTLVLTVGARLRCADSEAVAFKLAYGGSSTDSSQLLRPVAVVRRSIRYRIRVACRLPQAQHQHPLCVVASPSPSVASRFDSELIESNDDQRHDQVYDDRDH